MKYIILIIILISLIGCTEQTQVHEEKEEGSCGEWTDCPSGLTNDPYPGDCILYTDEDNNQICDLSE